jgi:osmotically-inducible protein OsmY
VLTLLTLPFRLLGLALLVVAGVTKLARGTLRAVGYRRIALLVTGALAGLLLAPVPGEQLRSRLREVLDERRGAAPPADVAERVREALSAAPSTWHLPQPALSLVDGRIVLTGTVPHETGRDELVRVATAVRGVAGVDDRLTIGAAGPPAPDPTPAPSAAAVGTDHILDEVPETHQPRP